MQYTVLLVDDEEEIREGIIRKIDWEKYGFRIAGSAGNGQYALEIAESIQPDVVMTDIMMPFMDGLALIQAVRAQQHSAEFVVIRAYADFE